jgi:DNA-directed RNA polymerase subunit RPC12/RpoP
MTTDGPNNIRGIPPNIIRPDPAIDLRTGSRPPLNENDFRSEGVRCPSCNCRHCPTIAGTHRHFRNSTRVKRRCRHCGREFYELKTLLQSVFNC